MSRHHDKNREDWANQLFNGGRNPKETIPQSAGADKISRYGWVAKDERGHYEQINKNLIVVDPTYQRTLSGTTIQKIASKWSWIACGTISVVVRDNQYYAIDGQHRVMAAQTRSDIDTLDCMVFKTSSIIEEAQGFVDCNIDSRCRVSALDTYKAELVAQDPDAMYLEKTFSDLGLHAGASKNPIYIGWIKTCYWMMRQSRPKFEQTLSLVKELGERYKEPVTEKLARGLFYLNQKLTVDFNDPRLRERILSFTIKEHNAAIRDMIVMSDCASFGGPVVYAKGLLFNMNKKLRNKFVYKEE